MIEWKYYTVNRHPTLKVEGKILGSDHEAGEDDKDKRNAKFP